MTLVGTGQDLYPDLERNCKHGIESVISDHGVPNHGNSGIGVVILGVRPESGGLSGQANVIASDKAPS